MSEAPQRPKILFVDDEARIVESIALNLRKEYEIHTATSGAEALRKLREVPGISVVVSDMRMPGMDGATLLHEVRQTHSAVSRLLLTGEAGRDAAAQAVNKGQILRFLTKPCPPDELKKAIEAGVAQYRLANIERAVLQETLLGCIHALVDLLSITNPLAFGRTSRVQRRSMEFAEYLGVAGYWQLEAAASLSQVGYIALRRDVLEKLYRGERLLPAEVEAAAAAPQFAMRLLEHVPRLDPVIQILVALEWDDAGLSRLGDGTIGLATRILGLVLEFDALTVQGHGQDAAVELLRSRAGRYGKDFIEKFGAHLGASGAGRQSREMNLEDVRPGMIIMQDLYDSHGMLMVSSGYRVTDAFRERATSLAADLRGCKVRVLLAAN